MANLKKILSSVVALALASSAMPMAFAENRAADATTEASIIYYRDYEDYATGNELFNNTHGIATAKGKNDAWNNSSTMIRGVDGVAVSSGNQTGSPYVELEEPITDGTVYIGIDIEGYTADELEAKGIEGDHNYIFVQSSDSNVSRYIRFGTGATTYGWEDIANYGQLADGYHRLEVMINLNGDTKTVDSYLDGEYVKTVNYGRTDVKIVKFAMYDSIKRMDNLSIVHYPTGCEKTMVLTGKAVDAYKNALVVDFDNYVSTVIGEKEYVANYPAIVNTELTKDMFTVTTADETPVEVIALEENAAIGSYSLILKDNINYDTTYTVSVSEALTDVHGATLDTTVSTEINPEQPTVLYFRDYENYSTGGEVFGDRYGATGSMGQNSPLNNASKVITGVDGKAVEPKGATGAPPFELGVENAITSGTIYIGMDVEIYSDAEYESGAAKANSPYIVVKGTNSNTGRYIRFAGGTTSTGAWEDISNYGKLAEGNHRLEVMINLDTLKVNSYLDGAYKETRDYARLGFHYFNVWFTDAIKRWDNFTVVHYPKGMDETFSVEATKPVSYENNTITIDFDSDAKTVTSNGTVYKANYPVILNRDITPGDVIVKNSNGDVITVSEVRKNAAFGSYDLVLENELEVETYTVEVTATDLTTCRGNEFKGTKITFTTPHPNVWVYRDYEDYTDGSDILNGGGKYGSWKSGAGTGFASTAKAAVAKDGKAVAFSAENGGWNGTGSYRYNFAEPIQDGKLYIGYDIEKKSDEELAEMGIEAGTCNELLSYLLAGPQWSDVNQAYIRMSVSDSTVTTGIGNWRNVISNYYLGSGYNRIEYIVDLDADTITRYVNGEQEAQASFTRDVYGYSQEFDKFVKYMDNFTILHLQEGSKTQTFSPQNAKADVETNTVSVQLRSDIKGAEYPIITDALTADDFMVMDIDGAPVTVTAVAAGDAIGEYVLTVDKDIVAGDMFTVIVTADRTNNMGFTLDTSAGAVAYAAGKFNASVKVTADANGTELTEAGIAALKKGDKVYAEVTYANPTEENVEFTLIGATYAGGRMTNVGIGGFTAYAYTAMEEKQYVEVEVTDVTNFSAKAFIVNGFDKLTPVK